MKSLWRICKQKYVASALDGEGARLAGGRWNERGTRLVYASESLSLATLETLVHAQSGQLSAAGLVAVQLHVPDGASVTELAPARLPAHWRGSPAPGELARLGSEWVRSSASLLLRVPSAVIPSEWNLLLNPAHPEMASVVVASTQLFDVDPRLRK